MTVFGSGGLRIHHYRGSIRVTDMTNAGRRGKKVREMSLVARGHDDAASEEKFIRLIDEILHMDYDAAKEHILGSSIISLDIHERLLRGVDVEQPATKINLEKKHDDGTIVTISASPHDFHVRSSALIYAPGKVAHGHRQDTSYWPSGSEARKKTSAGVFYEWLKRNLHEASNMTILELTRVWDSLGVGYSSH